MFILVEVYVFYGEGDEGIPKEVDCRDSCVLRSFRMSDRSDGFEAKRPFLSSKHDSSAQWIISVIA